MIDQTFQDSAPEKDAPTDSLSSEILDAISSGKDYAGNCVSLLAAEAKLAMASTMILLVMAVFALILLTSIWILFCALAAELLTYYAGFSLLATISSLLALNLFVLIVMGFLAVKLFQTIDISKSIESLSRV